MNDALVCKQSAYVSYRMLSGILDKKYGQVLAPKGFNFHIKLPDDSRIKMMSCCVPPDLNQDIYKKLLQSHNDRSVFNMIFETALLGSDGVVYDESLGYNDVLRFNSIEEVADEVKRVATALSWKVRQTEEQK